MSEARLNRESGVDVRAEEHPFDGFRIPDGWSPEVALAVSGALAGLDSAIWGRYGDEMIPLIAVEDDCEEHPAGPPMLPEDDIPF